MSRTLGRWNPRTVPQWKPPPLSDLKDSKGSFVPISTATQTALLKAYSEDGGNILLTNTDQTTRRHNLEDEISCSVTRISIGHRPFHILPNSTHKLIF
jgi:hypothetical protein